MDILIIQVFGLLQLQINCSCNDAY